jgi:hypothetical protein
MRTPVRSTRREGKLEAMIRISGFEDPIYTWKIREQVPLRAEAPRETLTAIHQS